MERGIRRGASRGRDRAAPGGRRRRGDGGDARRGLPAGRSTRPPSRGPLGTPVVARYGMLGDGETAVVEMAEASGLHLVPVDRRNPLVTTTFGTGELIKAALDRGARRLIVAIGGSATNDGAPGRSRRWGRSSWTGTGSPSVPAVGRSRGSRGSTSATRPATPRRVDARGKRRDEPASRPAGRERRLRSAEGSDPRAGRGARREPPPLRRRPPARRRSRRRVLPGSGAAGGLGAGLVACGGRLCAASIWSSTSRVRRALHDADAVFTGEGRLDEQTPDGKVVAGGSLAAGRQAVPVIAFAGSCLARVREPLRAWPRRGPRHRAGAGHPRRSPRGRGSQPRPRRRGGDPPPRSHPRLRWRRSRPSHRVAPVPRWSGRGGRAQDEQGRASPAHHKHCVYDCRAPHLALEASGPRRSWRQRSGSGESNDIGCRRHGDLAPRRQAGPGRPADRRRSAERPVLRRGPRSGRPAPARRVRHERPPRVPRGRQLQRGPHPRDDPGDLRVPRGPGHRRPALPGDGHPRRVAARAADRARGPRSARASRSFYQPDEGFTPTPAISRAILAWNDGRRTRPRRRHRRDAVPQPARATAGSSTTRPTAARPTSTSRAWSRTRANALLAGRRRAACGAIAVRERPCGAPTTHAYDFVRPYVEALSLRDRHGRDPRGRHPHRRRPPGRRERRVLGADPRALRPRPDRREPEGRPDVRLHDPGPRRPDPDGLLQSPTRWRT